MTRTNRSALLGTLLIAFIASTGTAMAQDKDTKWEKHHPRREEVNNRLKNQDKRIKQEVKEGEITKAQAKDLHKEDKQIRQEERDMASQNGGHITKAEQKALNQQENTVSKEIGK
jgi:hypothetical protein